MKRAILAGMFLLATSAQAMDTSEISKCIGLYEYATLAAVAPNYEDREWANEAGREYMHANFTPDQINNWVQTSLMFKDDPAIQKARDQVKGKTIYGMTVDPAMIMAICIKVM